MSQTIAGPTFGKRTTNFSSSLDGGGFIWFCLAPGSVLLRLEAYVQIQDKIEYSNSQVNVHDLWSICVLRYFLSQVLYSQTIGHIFAPSAEWVLGT